MIVLGIESSCDDCCVALVEDGQHVIAELQHDQTECHTIFGGVVPEIAARAHTSTILPLFLRLLEKSGCKRSEIDGVAVTEKPGLHNSLAVGVAFAQALAYALNIPCVGVNHLHAHLHAAHIEKYIEYPHLGVIVSGGHTIFGVVHDYAQYRILGQTIDDACGEAFDKIATHLGLGYPGGAEIEKLAKKGNPKSAHFPYSSLKNGRRFDISYSGLKTAVIHQIEQFWIDKYPRTIENIAAAFQHVALMMIVQHVEALIAESGITTVVCGGGVCANRTLVDYLHAIDGATIHVPPSHLCTDNATMIAAIGFHSLQHQHAEEACT